MGFLSDGLEPLREAQGELLLRLDAMLVELHTMSEVLHEVRGLLAAQAATDGTAPASVVVRSFPEIGA